MFSQIGPLEIVLVIVVLLVIFGPKRLPSLGRSLGTGMREFKDSVSGDKKTAAETRSELPPPAPAATTTPADDATPVPSQSERETETVS